LFLNQIADNFYRIKGYVKSDGKIYKVDTVNEQIDIEPFRYPVEEGAFNRLVCLASKGISSISKLAVTAAKYFEGEFDLLS
jgi:hypothetical protein